MTCIVSVSSACGAYAAAIMKTLPLLLAVVLMAVAPHGVAAAPGKPPEPPGKAAQADKPDPPGQAAKASPAPGKKGDGAPPGRGPAGDGPPGAGPSGAAAPPPDPATPSDAELDDLRRAVESHEALPLAQIARIAESRSDGRVIDAQLLTVQGVLLYRLTLLDDTGRSWREYYVARTGNPVKL